MHAWRIYNIFQDFYVQAGHHFQILAQEEPFGAPEEQKVEKEDYSSEIRTDSQIIYVKRL